MTKQEMRNFIAKRTAKFFNYGDVVNLGIGMPTLCLEHLPEGVDIWIESENGVLGLAGAPENEADGDIDIVDASGSVSTMRLGGCCFSSFDSFGLIRGGHVAATVLGAYEVDQEGNLANWMVPGKTCAGMGGAMDLVSGAKNVLIMMEHTDKYGNPKILKKCTLPLTAANEVDYIITELCVLHCTKEGLVLEELAPDVTVEEVVSKTGADLIIPEVIGCME